MSVVILLFLKIDFFIKIKNDIQYKFACENLVTTPLLTNKLQINFEGNRQNK